MPYHFRNLVLEGGGVKGIAYVGAMGVLDEKGILPDIVRVGGASAGAINAVLIGLGYSVREMRNVLWELDFRNFLDDSWGVVRDTKRLIEEFGWYRGDFFRDWIGQVIRKKTGNENATFRDVDVWITEDIHPFKHMYFMGTNLSTGYAEVFSHEHTPRMAIADVVRLSMSIPLFFAAKRNFRGDLFVDGGMLDNYPVKLFDRKKYVEAHSIEREYYADHNEELASEGLDTKKGVAEYVFNQETLGFRLDSKTEIGVFRDQAEPPRSQVGDFFEYISSLVRTLLNAQQSSHLHSDDWHRTIYIDTLGVGTTDFGLTDTRKKELVKSGKTGATEYFEWYDNAPASEKVWNRPA